MKKRWIPLLLMLAVLISTAEARKPEEVGPYLQSISVTIKKGSDRGSGTVVTRQVEGKAVNWILTAAHVVADLRQVKTIIDEDGDEKKRVTYRDSEVLQELSQDGRTVGEIKIDAKVVSVDVKRDIALLRVRKTDFLSVSAEFYAADTVPPVGTSILHCGSPGGQAIGAASVTSGVLSRVGVRIEEYGGADGIYDQVDCAALGGSSGGMVCLKDTGHYIGMITLGLRGGDNFHWMVPIRTIREWADDINAEWLLDAKAKPPSEEDVKKIPLEVAASGFHRAEDAETVSTTELEIGHAILND